MALQSLMRWSEGKTMRDHLRFAAVHWHVMRGTGGDMFGWGTARRTWNTGECNTREAIARAHAFFEFAGKLRHSVLRLP